MLWPKNLSKKIKNKINLAKYTSFKIGGSAKFFFEPKDLKSLQEILIYAKKSKIKVFILGAGSNILINDSGVKGIVIKLNSDNFNFVKYEDACIVAGAGVRLNSLIQQAKAKGLSGLEFLIGIPGTLGGALAGNAGAWGKEIGKLVKEVSVLDYSGKLIVLRENKLKFVYRKSNLNKYIIIAAKLKLKKAGKNSINLKIKEYLLKRSQTQDNRLPNAGCIFKNPPNNSAGFLIDSCGLKGRQYGEALVSKAHANFILNLGKAKSSDVKKLMNLMQKKVKEKFRIVLEPEIKIWG